MRLLKILAALSGALAVAAGAYGAHGAHGAAAQWLRTGSEYQLIHAVAAIAFSKQRAPAWAMLLGAGVFAGTLYLMAFGAPRWLGAVTPIGGLAMIGGWLLLATRR